MQMHNIWPDPLQFPDQPPGDQTGVEAHIAKQFGLKRLKLTIPVFGKTNS